MALDDRVLLDLGARLCASSVTPVHSEKPLAEAELYGARPLAIRSYWRRNASQLRCVSHWLVGTRTTHFLWTEHNSHG